eukprot:PDM72487.1 cytochrome P450 [Pristionchus pacificus]
MRRSLDRRGLIAMRLRFDCDALPILQSMGFRWLIPSFPRHAFQSFGEGPRMCIGMRLAIMEEKIMLVHLLKNFRVCKSENTNPIELVGDLTVSPTKVMVRLESL